MTKKHWFQAVVLSLLSSSICQAQSGDKEDSGIPKDGRFLLDLTYTNTDSFEGDVDAFSPGFTWLVRPDLRVTMATTFVRFKPDSGPKLNPREGESSHGLGDTLFTMQYDWAARLTASPWIPDDLGMSLYVLAPTGEAERFLGTDSWQASLSMSWPVEIEGGWLLNPVISYNFSFNEGPLAQPLNVVETGIGIIKVLPSKFWIAYTPSLWFDFDVDSWNFDDHLTVGKMFSNGVGLSLDFGRLARHSRVLAEDDRSLLLNFYFQFGR